MEVTAIDAVALKVLIVSMSSAGSEPKPDFHVFLNVNVLKHSLGYWQENLPKIRAEIANQHGVFATYTVCSMAGDDPITLLPLSTEAAKKFEEVLPKIMTVIGGYNV